MEQEARRAAAGRGGTLAQLGGGVRPRNSQGARDCHEVTEGGWLGVRTRWSEGSGWRGPVLRVPG